MTPIKTTFDREEYPLQDETYLLNGIAMEIHKILGRGYSEIVYKDAFELELRNREIPYQREKEYKLYPKVYLYRRIVQSKLFIDRHYAEKIDLNNNV